MTTRTLRIGFIAMSGVRAWDAELLALGLSMPGFVERKEVIAQLPSLGLLTLVGLTPMTDAASYHEVFDFAKDSPPEGPFDLVHSVIVFQHIPVLRGEALFAEMLKSHFPCIDSPVLNA